MRAPKENSQAIKSFLLDVSDYHKTLDKNDSLFEPGDNIQYLYMVTSGKIVLSKPLMDGREFSLRICEKGDLVGEADIFSKHGKKHILHATALRKSSVVGINNERLIHLLSKHDELAIFLLNEISQNALRDQTKLIDLVMYGKKGALYSTLLRLANSYGLQKNDGTYINLALTNQELANFCGTSRENINRSLSKLRKERIISIRNNHITIHNIDFLKEELNCAGCPITLCSIH